ncbi:MAG: hypothetical protein ACUVQD_01380 [Thermaceae bacterium]
MPAPFPSPGGFVPTYPGGEAPLAHVLHHLVEHAQHRAGQVIYAHKLLKVKGIE